MVRAGGGAGRDLLLVFVMAVSAVAAGAEDGNFVHSDWEWVFGIAVGGVVAGSLLQFAVIVFSRPRFVVPPHLRGEPGVVDSRRRRRQGGETP